MLRPPRDAGGRNAGGRRAGAALAAALLLAAGGAEAQTPATPPTPPLGTAPSPEPSTTDESPLGLRANPATSPTRALPSGASRAASSGRAPAVTGAGDRGATNLLRQRAAPPRRIGSATARITREVTQAPPPALRLSPVVRVPVVGAPVATTLPLAGLSTPGAVLGLALRRPLAVDDAYAPLGIKLGTFTLFPALQQNIGYDTNPDQINRSLAKGSTALRTDGELNFRSDWSSSELAGELRAGYLEYPDNQAANRPNGAGNVRLRLDANRDTQINVEGRFIVDTQRAGSPDLNAQVAARPIVASYGTTVGVTESFNRLRLTASGLFDRSEFEDARLASGTVITQSDRNLNQYGLRLRAAYEISPVITPFVEALADTRVYDQRIDSTGTRRDSNGVTLSGGAAFALTRFVSGEVSVGLQRRTYVDPTLRDLYAPVINASVIWFASPLTTVRLGAVANVTETAVVGSSGIRTQAATLEAQHDLLRNLSITVGAGYLANDYDRANISERGFSATARLDYRFNRWLSMRGSYIYQQIDSSSPGASFSANTWLLGMRVSP